VPGRFHISFVLSAIAWGLLLVLGGLGPLKSLVAEVQAWLSPIFCAAGDHLQAFHRCVGPGAPGGNATVAIALLVLYVASVIAVYCLLGIVWKRKQRARSAKPAAVGNFAAPATQPPPIDIYPPEYPVDSRTDHESAASRSFVARPPMFGPNASGWIGVTLAFILMLAAGAVMLVGLEQKNTGLIIGPVVVLALGFGAYLAWSGMREVQICVTGDDLTVGRRSGDVFSLRGAKLGPWADRGGMPVGTALHLQSGPHQLVIGGRDYRTGTGTPLEAPSADSVDAWMSASDFEQLLTMVSGPSWLTRHQPAPGGSTRCLLFPNDQILRQMVPVPWALRDRAQYQRSATQPQLALEVGPDAIRVVDPNTNTQIAWASPAQVTASPETYILRRNKEVGRPSPVLVVAVPGFEPLTIGCHERAEGMGMGQIRFSWRGKVPERTNNPAAYMVSGMDWLTLVEKCGFAAYLEDRSG